ncbi:MAG: hypothetical protein ACRDSP_11105 [Pseudonocardiaceae bacterium]
MSTPLAIGLGILAWVLLAIVLAFFVGYLIQLRDRQRLDRPRHGEPVKLRSGNRAGTPPQQTRPGWELHDGD